MHIIAKTLLSGAFAPGLATFFSLCSLSLIPIPAFVLSGASYTERQCPADGPYSRKG